MWRSPLTVPSYWKLCEKNQYNKDGVPGKVEVAYLTDANRRLMVKRNPTRHTMECDLLVRGRSSGASVGVFSEDGQARWLIKEILSETYLAFYQKSPLSKSRSAAVSSSDSTSKTSSTSRIV